MLDFNSFTNAALWNKYLAQPNIDALFYLEYSKYSAPGGALYFSTNGKPVLSAATLSAGATWAHVINTPARANGQWSVAVPAGSGTRFFQLRTP